MSDFPQDQVPEYTDPETELLRHTEPGATGRQNLPGISMYAYCEIFGIKLKRLPFHLIKTLSLDANDSMWLEMYGNEGMSAREGATPDLYCRKHDQYAPCLRCSAIREKQWDYPCQDCAVVPRRLRCRCEHARLGVCQCGASFAVKTKGTAKPCHTTFVHKDKATREARATVVVTVDGVTRVETDPGKPMKPDWRRSRPINRVNTNAKINTPRDGRRYTEWQPQRPTDGPKKKRPPSK